MAQVLHRRTADSQTIACAYGTENRVHIVVGEDDGFLVKAISMVLLRERFDVTVIGEGPELVDFMVARKEQEMPADLLICDLNLPGMSGTEAVRRLREAGINVPVLFVSGEDERKNANDLNCRGHHEFLAKPFTREDLIERVQGIITTSDEKEEVTR